MSPPRDAEAGTYQRRWESLLRDNLRQDEQRREPAPRQEPRAQIMPKCDECEYENAGGCEAARTTERDVEVSHDPEVV